jgi:hypothetical protein
MSRKARIVEFKEAEYKNAEDWTVAEDGAVTVNASVTGGTTIDLPEPIEFVPLRPRLPRPLAAVSEPQARRHGGRAHRACGLTPRRHRGPGARPDDARRAPARGCPARRLHPRPDGRADRRREEQGRHRRARAGHRRPHRLRRRHARQAQRGRPEPAPQEGHRRREEDQPAARRLPGAARGRDHAAHGAQGLPRVPRHRAREAARSGEVSGRRHPQRPGRRDQRRPQGRPRLARRQRRAARRDPQAHAAGAARRARLPQRHPEDQLQGVGRVRGAQLRVRRPPRADRRGRLSPHLGALDPLARAAGVPGVVPRAAARVHARPQRRAEDLRQGRQPVRQR